MRSSIKRTRKINIEGIGEILLERSRRAKHINISLRPFKGVRVAVPYGVSFARAEEVAKAKVTWIQKHLERMGDIEQEVIELRKSNHIDRKQARKQLVKRLDELSQTYGFRVLDITGYLSATRKPAGAAVRRRIIST